MPFKTALAALALTVLPTLSFAICTGIDHQAQSCATGTIWDAETQQCVEQVSS